MRLPRLPFHLFRGTPTDHVIVYRNGKQVGSALGGSFWIFPWNTLVRIPRAELSKSFSFREVSSDLQEMLVNGEVRVRLNVEVMAGRHDFSADPVTGAYLTDDIRKVEDEVRNALSGYVRREVAASTLRSLLTAADAVRDSVWKKVVEDKGTFDSLGVEVVGIVVTAISPANPKLREALEAETREKMLAAADKAVHERRMSSAEADRAHKEYELLTQRTLEESRTALLAIANANQIAQATADAEAAKKRLEPYRDAPADVLFALALQKAAETGIGTLNVSPDLLAAFRTLKGTE